MPAWVGGSGEGERFKQALTVKGNPSIAAEGQQSRFGSRTAPSEWFVVCGTTPNDIKILIYHYQKAYLQGNLSNSILCALLCNVLYYESISF